MRRNDRNALLLAFSLDLRYMSGIVIVALQGV